jgi:hypothetical protein
VNHLSVLSVRFIVEQKKAPALPLQNPICAIRAIRGQKYPLNPRFWSAKKT